MNLLKHLKDFKDGVVDSLITAPYALSDFIARGILEFLRIILEFLEIASLRSQ